MNKIYFFVPLIGILFGSLQPASAGKNDFTQKYKCNHDAEGRTFCLDEKGKPLTGKKVRAANDHYVSIESYTKGYRDGLTTFFDDDGRVAERTYYKQGVKNGMSKTYHPTGGIKTNVQYKDGILHGQAETYDSKGKLLGRMRYKYGKLEKGSCRNQNGKEERFTPQFIAAQPENQLVNCEAQ